MSESHSGWGSLFTAENRGSAITLSGGVALYATNSYIVITILPSVVEDIGGMAWYAWNTTLFVVSAIMGAALSARLLGRCGPRWAYLNATAIFMAGAAICTVAPSMPILLLGRAVQGLGGGFLFAMSYAMVNQVFEEKLWPRAMALISAMWGVATLVGPAVGGIFAELHAWRYAFGLLLPVTLLFALLVWKSLPARQQKRSVTEPLPRLQLVLLASAVLAVSAGSLSPHGWMNFAGIVAAIVLVLWLRKREYTTPVRLLPRDALSLSSPLCALFATMALLMIGMGFDIYVPYLLQHLHGQTPLMAGYITAAGAAGWTLGEMWSASWPERRTSTAIRLGPPVMILSLLCLLVSLPVVFGDGWMNMGLIVLGLTLLGFATGIGWPHLLTRVLQHATAEDKEKAGASISVVQSFSAAMGTALAGTVANLSGIYVPGGTQGVSQAAFWLSLLFIAAPLVAIISARRATRTEPVMQPEESLNYK
ncbi:MFS transporter [Rouxiella badensis]|jgi:MFS family permease|uniref:MFS transporter n=1 Tax=Rouxiella badensis TaxID=1646377 RepID=UPI00036EABA7|nr:MFS transporter [Rouxiella badensis]MCC3717408.1 MFS transporter [Rouxiella badensis]MCC3727648.1 MFS transporter [Rouxiella badensis]MCC3732408.1 MFS transporter [Rouxiella badensis]MCC3740480.1 MFS transporter [Rouxiella badensis]MCC3758254.1 MFS transporter [Rouxiella badensis]